MAPVAPCADGAGASRLRIAPVAESNRTAGDSGSSVSTPGLAGVATGPTFVGTATGFAPGARPGPAAGCSSTSAWAMAPPPGLAGLAPLLPATGTSRNPFTRVLRRPRRWRNSAPLSSRLPAGPLTRARRMRPVRLTASTSMRLTPAVSRKTRRSCSGSMRCCH